MVTNVTAFAAIASFLGYISVTNHYKTIEHHHNFKDYSIIIAVIFFVYLNFQELHLLRLLQVRMTSWHEVAAVVMQVVSIFTATRVVAEQTFVKSFAQLT